jgi:hypothetical protein
LNSPAPSLSGYGIASSVRSVRNPSAVASSAGYENQHRQPSEQQILDAANAVASDKRPSRLVRIE